MLTTIWQDIRCGFRTLLKYKSFTTIAVAVIALGVGANTAIFSVVNAVLLRSLPYRDENRLVMVCENDTLEGNPKNAVAPANFFDFREQSQAFDHLGTTHSRPASI